MSQDVERMLDAYERTINEIDGDRQHAAAREALTDDFRFVGPQLGQVVGRTAMVEAVNGAREQAPSDSVQIRRTTAVDEHNGWLRFGWEFVDGAGRVLAAGMDVARLAPDGRLSQVVAFFGELEPGGD